MPRRPALALVVLVALGLCGGIWLVAGPAADADNRTVNAADGIAIKGYDPVAYFTDGRPVPGAPANAVERGGARWLFASAEHRAAFLADTERYTPAYGGFCAFGVAKEKKVDIDPQAWSIVGGRLYLNYDADVQATWRKDPAGYIAQADHNWPRLHGGK